jgi:hypothetical protein
MAELRHGQFATRGTVEVCSPNPDRHDEEICHIYNAAERRV